MISRVSKTLSRQNSRNVDKGFRAYSQKPCSDLSETKKGIYNSLEPFIKDFEQILKNGFQKTRTLQAVCKNLEQFLKNRVQKYLKPKNVFRTL